MTKGDFLVAYNIGHRDGKTDAYCPNDYDDIFDIGQQSCDHSEKPNKWINKPQESENEKIIRISKGTLKARTGKYVIYDVEWLKTHFNTTEAKIYGQPSEDCISRKFMHDMGATCIAARNKDGDLVALGALDILPSANLQPKTGHWIEHKHGGIEHIECSKCKCWFLKKDLIRNSYCPNCGSRNHWEWELKMQEEKK